MPRTTVPRRAARRRAIPAGRAGKPQTKISLSELTEKVNQRRLTQADFAKYFVIDSTACTGFAPPIALNREAVDLEGAEGILRIGPEFALRALEAVRESRLRAARAPRPNGTILAEGDSWFNLPDLGVPIVPPTVIDHLAEKFPINNIAHWGDTLEQIKAQGEYRSFLRNNPVKFFLFSAGGNDALGGGQLAAYLKQRQSGDNDPAHAPRYVRPEYFALLDSVQATYGAIVDEVLRISPTTKMLIHGYDYCIPLRAGRWLGEPLRFRGFDVMEQRALSRAIIKILLNAFNDRLKQIAAQHSGHVTYVSLFNTVMVSRWWDELHPNKDAAKDLARKFEPHLK